MRGCCLLGGGRFVSVSKMSFGEKSSHHLTVDLFPAHGLRSLLAAVAFLHRKRFHRHVVVVVVAVHPRGRASVFVSGARRQRDPHHELDLLGAGVLSREEDQLLLSRHRP